MAKCCAKRMPMRCDDCTLPRRVRRLSPTNALAGTPASASTMPITENRRYAYLFRIYGQKRAGALVASRRWLPQCRRSRDRQHLYLLAPSSGDAQNRRESWQYNREANDIKVIAKSPLRRRLIDAADRGTFYVRGEARACPENDVDIRPLATSACRGNRAPAGVAATTAKARTKRQLI